MEKHQVGLRNHIQVTVDGGSLWPRVSDKMNGSLRIPEQCSGRLKTCNHVFLKVLLKVLGTPNSLYTMSPHNPIL